MQEATTHSPDNANVEFVVCSTTKFSIIKKKRKTETI